MHVEQLVLVLGNQDAGIPPTPGQRLVECGGKRGMLLEQGKRFGRRCGLKLFDQLIKRTKYLFKRFASGGIDMP